MDPAARRVRRDVGNFWTNKDGPLSDMLSFVPTKTLEVAQFTNQGWLKTTGMIIDRIPNDSKRLDTPPLMVSLIATNTWVNPDDTRLELLKTRLGRMTLRACQTAFKTAVSHDSLAEVGALLKNGRVNPTAEYTSTTLPREWGRLQRSSYPLLDAVKNSSVRVVNRLLKDSRVLKNVEQKHRAFVLAASNGYEQIMRIFIENGWDPSTNNDEALKGATRNDCANAVTLLLNDRRVANRHRAFVLAAKHNHVKVMKAFIENRWDPSFNNDEAIRKAAKYDDCADAVKYLLQDSRVLQDRHNKHRAFVLAARSNSCKVMKVFIENGWNPGAYKNEALREAVTRHRNNAVRLLLKNPNVDPTANNNQAIRDSIKRDVYHTYNIAKHLLKDQRVNPGIGNNELIIWAVNNYPVMKILMNDSRVDPTVNDNQPFKKVLDLSFKSGTFGVLQLLLLYCPRVNGPDNNTNLWRIVSEKTNIQTTKKTIKILKLLLDKIPNHDQALIWAARNGHDMLVKLVMEDQHVNPAANDNQALKEARRNHHDQVVNLLLRDQRVQATNRTNP